MGVRTKYISNYLYTLATSPSLGGSWGFYSVLLAMTRDPAEFGWHYIYNNKCRWLFPSITKGSPPGCSSTQLAILTTQPSVTDPHPPTPRLPEFLVAESDHKNKQRYITLCFLKEAKASYVFLLALGNSSVD